MHPDTRVGDYRLVSQLHQGGMAAVWLARRDGGELVALKLVHSHFANDPVFTAMLQEEARIVARVSHPHVVPILDVGQTEDGIAYLVMEHCDGVTLGSLLEARQRVGQPLSVAAATAIACRVGDGLEAAHQTLGEDGRPLELIHRDVSPSNIMISNAGDVKIIDFGVARARGRAIKTTAGTLKGKYGYMAPEATTGQSIDQRTDLYSLAIVLWESLTGRRYFDSKLEIEKLMMARRPRLVRASQLREQLPAALDEALTRALSPKAADRFDTVADFVEAARAAVPLARAVDGNALGQLVSTTLDG